MGQRANYIVKNGDELTIFYNHWRAICIASDLYLGEKRFLAFVKNCQPHEEILTYPWIEGCVVVDMNTKSLSFWSYDCFQETSVVDHYLVQLSEKWPGWKLTILKNRMYDVEKILAIDCTSAREIQPIERPAKEEVLADKVEVWPCALVIIKQGSSLFVTKTGELNAEKIIGYGQEIIPLLQTKIPCDLPKEGKQDTLICVLIDPENKTIMMNEHIAGLAATCGERWPGYTITTGDYGYIETLRLGNIPTAHLLLSEDEVKHQFEEMVSSNYDFNPVELAEKIKKNNKDVEFNPNFFDNVKPKTPLMHRLYWGLKKLIRQ